MGWRQPGRNGADAVGTHRWRSPQPDRRAAQDRRAARRPLLPRGRRARRRSRRRQGVRGGARRSGRTRVRGLAGNAGAGGRAAARPAARPRDRGHPQRHALRDHEGVPALGLQRALREAARRDGGGGRRALRGCETSGCRLRRELRLFRLPHGRPGPGDDPARRPRRGPGRRRRVLPRRARRRRRRAQPSRPLAVRSRPVGHQLRRGRLRYPRARTWRSS